MTELNSHVCFDALATLQNVQSMEDDYDNLVTSHYSKDCAYQPDAQNIFDNVAQNISRSSVPEGLQVYDSADGTCVITLQKFAKGTRFGPVQARTTCIPIKNLKFPLVIFANTINDDFITPEMEELFTVRNQYLDTSDENHCNWMVHVNPAQYSNEQNMIAFQEENHIYFMTTLDVEVGDILKVWYAPKYAERMKVKLLEPSPYEIINNVLKQVSINNEMGINDTVLNDISSSIINSGYNNYYSTNQPACSSSSSEVALPSINSIMKSSNTLNYPYIQANSYSMVPQIEVPPINSSGDTAFSHNVNQMIQYSPATSNLSSTPVMNQATSSNVYVDEMKSNSVNNNYLIQQTEQETSQTVPIVVKSSKQSNTETPQKRSYNKTKNTKIESSSEHSSDAEYVSNDLITIKYEPVTNEDGSEKSKECKKSYNCKICNRKYSSLSNIHKHMKTHNLFFCNSCHQSHESENDLINHSCNNRSSKKNLPQCTICFQYLCNAWSLTRHMKTHTSPEKKDKLVTQGSINSTSSNNSEDGKLINASFNESFESFSELDVNRSTAMDQLSSMNYTEEVESKPNPINPEMLMTDIKPNINEDAKNVETNQFQCVVCAKRYPKETALRKHLRETHTVKIRINKKKAAALKEESETVVEDKMKSPVQIDSNVQNTSPVKPSIAKALAQKLNKTQNRMVEDLNHNNIPQKGNDFRIEGANSTASNSSNSSQFIGSMSDVNDHDGPGDCKKLKLESSKFELNTDDMDASLNPFAIDNPEPKKTSSKKQHVCDICNKSFTQAYQMHRHKQTHEDSYFDCPFCDGKKLKCRSSVRKHLMAFHSDNKQEWDNKDFINRHMVGKVNDSQNSSFEIDLQSPSTTNQVTNNDVNSPSVVDFHNVLSSGNQYNEMNDIGPYGNNSRSPMMPQQSSIQQYPMSKDSMVNNPVFISPMLQHLEPDCTNIQQDVPQAYMPVNHQQKHMKTHYSTQPNTNSTMMYGGTGPNATHYSQQITQQHSQHSQQQQLMGGYVNQQSIYGQQHHAPLPSMHPSLYSMNSPQNKHHNNDYQMYDDGGSNKSSTNILNPQNRICDIQLQQSMQHNHINNNHSLYYHHQNVEPDNCAKVNNSLNQNNVGNGYEVTLNQHHHSNVIGPLTNAIGAGGGGYGNDGNLNNGMINQHSGHLAMSGTNNGGNYMYPHRMDVGDKSSHQMHTVYDPSQNYNGMKI